jgi:hypothetical protein
VTTLEDATQPRSAEAKMYVPQPARLHHIRVTIPPVIRPRPAIARVSPALSPRIIFTWQSSDEGKVAAFASGLSLDHPT